MTSKEAQKAIANANGDKNVKLKTSEGKVSYQFLLNIILINGQTI